MPSRALVLLLATATVLSGCIGGSELDAASTDLDPVDTLSEALFGTLPGESVWIEASSDDTRLHTRLFKPDLSTHEAGDAWQAPTILVMSPYFGHDAREDEMDASSAPSYYRYQWLIEHFVPRGYVVAFSDVRGTGDSGGCLEQTATLQRQDGHDIVEWLATQDWSNGKVGMFGKSYDAETQQGTAITAPPHLTTIIPVASVSGQYEWNFYDGVPFTLHTLIGNAGYMATDGLQPPTTEEGLVQYPTRAGCHPIMLSQAAHRDGDWDAYWAEREFRPHADNIEASVLYVHGLQDWNVRHTAIRDWFDAIPSEKRAILGQWAHDYPEENRYEEDWSRTDWRDIVHRWYDHELLGLDNGILDDFPPVQAQDSEGTWWAEDTWPPTDTTPLDLQLTPDGTMVIQTSAAEFDEPMLLRENDEAFARSMGVPLDDVDTGDVRTSLSFTSDPFPSTTHLSAWPVLTFDGLLFDGLYPDPDTETDAHFAANLHLIDEDGDETWFNAGYLSARHRNGVDAPEPVPEDERIVYELRFHPGETVIPAGSALRLVLSGSDDATEPEGTAWGMELWQGTLTLPTLDRRADGTQEPLDVPMGEPCTSVEC